MVGQRCGVGWVDELAHIAVGALAVHRLRLLDLSISEEVLLLELIEGGNKYIRCHNGTCFMYTDSGHWESYKGGDVTRHAC